jgi:acyl-CoA reductase-like NAD-dependent aldehyde dehydrogenase
MRADSRIFFTGFPRKIRRTGRTANPAYLDVEQAAQLAAKAFTVYGNLAGAAKAEFLRTIAVGIEERGTEIVDRARVETGLPEARLRGELARTTNQLRLFAGWSKRDPGSAHGSIPPSPSASHYRARTSVPCSSRLDRSRSFGASNFPIAFSVAGGDTASALAAGNPSHRQSASGPSGHERTGWPGDSRQCTSMRAARRGLFAALRCADRGRHPAGCASTGESCGIHRFASCRVRR